MKAIPPIPTKITPSLLKEIIDQIMGTHIVDFSGKLKNRRISQPIRWERKRESPIRRWKVRFFCWGWWEEEKSNYLWNSYEIINGWDCIIDLAVEDSGHYMPCHSSALFLRALRSSLTPLYFFPLFMSSWRPIAVF